MTFELRQGKSYPQLDGLRALAAIAVLLFHHCPTGAPWLNALAAAGPAAVGFFFLLSGFVLAQRHPLVEDPHKFWRARFIRIYPMYLFAFLLFAPIVFYKDHHNLKILGISFALNLFMVQSWSNLSQSWNGPSWSLSVEAFFYASFPFFVRRVAKLKHPAWWGILGMVPALATIGFCRGWVTPFFWRTWVENSPLFWLPVFLFGIALGLSSRPRRQTHKWTDLKISACLLGIVGLALSWPVAYREVFINGAVVVPLGCLIILCTYKSPLMEILLGNKFMVRLGQASYIIYIVQSPLWHYFRAFVNSATRQPIGDTTTSVARFVLYTVILLPVSVLLDSFVDEPIRRWLSGRRSQTVRRAIAAPASGS